MGSKVLLGFIIIKTITSFEVKGKKEFNKKNWLYPNILQPRSKKLYKERKAHRFYFKFLIIKYIIESSTMTV